MHRVTFSEPSIDDDPNQSIGPAPARRLGQCRAQYPGGSLVRRRHTHFNTRGAGANSRGADAVDRQYREHNWIGGLHRFAPGKAMQQRNPSQAVEARLTH